MNALREQIRSLLREELAALRSEHAQPAQQAVRIEQDSDLLHFARNLLARAAQDPGFVADVNAGRVRFVLERTVVAAPALVTSTPPARACVPCLDKTLVTEKDLATVGQGQRVLRVGRHCRLTPLAQDEARRRGIRIERNTA